MVTHWARHYRHVVCVYVCVCALCIHVCVGVGGGYRHIGERSYCIAQLFGAFDAFLGLS